jgi:arsenate reductase (thioredoxin)
MTRGMTLLAVCSIAMGPPLAIASTPDAKPKNVLFMCPHGAGKSVLAAAYFNRLAKDKGLNVHVDSAGTDADAVVAPVVATHLKKNGYEIPIAKPRLATVEDMASADIVVSMGCKLDNLPKPRGTLLKWDDVPGPGEDFAGADEAIKKHVGALVEDLVVRQERSQNR